MADMESWQRELDRLRQLREEKDLSFADLAKELNISEQYLAMIELGEILPTEKEQELIVQYILDSLT